MSRLVIVVEVLPDPDPADLQAVEDEIVGALMEEARPGRPMSIVSAEWQA